MEVSYKKGKRYRKWTLDETWLSFPVSHPTACDKRITPEPAPRLEIKTVFHIAVGFSACDTRKMEYSETNG